MKKIIYAGLDVHKENIRIAIFLENSLDPVEEKTIFNEKNKIKSYFKKWQENYLVKACYEAGCCGFELQRFLEKIKIKCEIIAPGRIPREPADKIKTDKKDARKLGKLLRNGDAKSIYIPSQDHESVRDYIRAREDLRIDLLRNKQRLQMFLLRHDYKFEEKRPWTLAHKKWMQNLQFEHLFLKSTFDEYYTRMEELETRLHGMDDTIEAIANSEQFTGEVSKLRCFKGINYLTALSIISEIGDFRRFSTAESFMSYLGMVPGEWSSGSKRRQGRITKSGNSHLRRLFTEAAWHYRHNSTEGKGLSNRRKGQDEKFIAYAKKATSRLNKKFKKLLIRGKEKNKISTAVARELAGFVWGMMLGKVA